MTTSFGLFQQINRCQSSLHHLVPGKVTVRGKLTLANKALATRRDGYKQCTLATLTPSRRFNKAVRVVVWGSKSGRKSRAGLSVSCLFEKFTEQAIKAVVRSQTEAQQLGSVEVEPEHLLLGMIATSHSSGFFGCKIDFATARREAQAMLAATQQKPTVNTQPKEPAFSPSSMNLSARSKKVLENAQLESSRTGMSTITIEHICIALFANGSSCRRIVASLGQNPDALKANAAKKLQGDQESEGQRKKVTTTSSKTTSKTLKELCKDMCEAAQKRTTDPVFGRSNEVQRVIQILARRSKNNPILLGEPGVGKTAIAEGLAHCIVRGFCPDGSALPSFLAGKRIMQLDVGLLIAGAKERGELEKRITSMIQELKNNKDIILMIDEIHMLVGGGSVRSGGLDIANLMKPALARGQVQCIGATTLLEHRKYFERDAAMDRRFQPVMVQEPSQQEALVILEGLKERYERHHQCIYDAEALSAAVKLTSRYIPDRYLPDKAIDVMDEAGSRVRIEAYTARRAAVLGKNFGEWEHLVQVLDAKDEAVQTGHFEEAQVLRDHELELKEKLVRKHQLNMMGKLSQELGIRPDPVGQEQAVFTRPPLVSVADVEAVVSSWSGVPMQQITADETSRLRQLEPALKKQVIGQEEAVQSVASALKRARLGLKDPSRPIATLLFCGPTGVGKTQLTKVLTEQYFGSADAMLRLDMSEYMERHSVAKLIGAPPGYVGYGDGGKLTEAVRRKPFCVLLLDEIEKAHPDVYNILLQVMEDGRFTDSTGRTVSFRNCLIVMTSNVGSSVIAKGGGALGFSLPSSSEDTSYNSIHSLVMDELKAYFRPELLNRLDETVVFRQLSRTNVRQIADLVLAETASQLAKQDIQLRISPTVMSKILEEGYDEAYGARPLKRAVANIIESVLSDALLHGRIVGGDIAHVDCDSEQNVFVSAQPQTPVEPLRNSIVQADGLLQKINADFDVINA